VYWYFGRFEQAKAGEKILPVVRAQLRLQKGRNPEPSAVLIDSQSVKLAERQGRRHRRPEHRGYDAGKKVNGRKRFIVADTLGLLLVVVVLAASTQDRDGAKPALLTTLLRTRVRFAFADDAFSGRLLDWAQTSLHHPGRRAQRGRPAGIGRDPPPVGGRAQLGLADRAPPPGRRLPGRVRGHEPLSRNQHHHPTHRPRIPGDPPGNDAPAQPSIDSLKHVLSLNPPTKLGR
jgi:hypothetical protein